MNVGSLLEVYTTMFGWSVYNTIYELFSATGLLVFPFLMMIIKNWKEPMESQNDKAASMVSQARVNISALSMMAVFMIAVVPFAGVDLNEMRYRVACTDKTGGLRVLTDVVGSSTGTTFDGQLAEINNVKIPILWWLVTSVGSGVNAAISISFTCFEDIKGLDMQLRNLTIKDKDLRSEYFRFANDCYLPAKSKYTAAMAGGQYYNYVKTQWEDVFLDVGFPGAGNLVGKYLNRRGHDDWTYIGSHFYLQTKGFYKQTGAGNCLNQFNGCSFQAKKGVPDWPILQSRDGYSDEDIDPLLQDPNKPLYGRPYCDDWWEDSTRGLKKKLLDNIEASSAVISVDPSYPNESVVSRMFRIIPDAYAWLVNNSSKYYYAQAELEDIVIKNYVARDPPSFIADKGGWLGNNDFVDFRTDSNGQALEKVAGAIGGAALIANPAVSKMVFDAAGKGAGSAADAVASQLVNFYTSVFIAKQVAPMVQAILLMMIYMLLLIYLIMSSYDIDATIQMVFIILGIQFFTTLWNFADYLDAQLFISMHPNVTMLGSVATMGINRLMLDVVLSLLYVIVPFLLLWIMNMAGSKVSALGGAMGSLGKPGGSNVGKGLSGTTSNLSSTIKSEITK